MAKKRRFSAYVHIDGIVSFPIYADSPEEALNAAKEEMKKLQLIHESVEYIDGKEELEGVIADRP